MSSLEIVKSLTPRLQEFHFGELQGIVEIPIPKMTAVEKESNIKALNGYAIKYEKADFEILIGSTSIILCSINPKVGERWFVEIPLIMALLEESEQRGFSLFISYKLNIIDEEGLQYRFGFVHQDGCMVKKHTA
ncbi:hypothetical protein D3C71_1609540 [compost metagenome]